MWETIMAARNCVVAAMDENKRISEELAINYARLEKALVPLDTLLNAHLSAPPTKPVIA
jgi:hypothetical protein